MKHHNTVVFTTMLFVFLVVLIAAGINYCVYTPSVQNAAPNNANANTNTTAQQNTTLSTTLPTPYISEVEGWPPAIIVSSTPYSCTVTSPASQSMDITVERRIGDRTYCIVTHTENAAGNIYADYTYTTRYGSRTKTTHFTLQYVHNCGAFMGTPEETACTTAQSNFDLDGIVNKVMQELELYPQPN